MSERKPLSASRVWGMGLAAVVVCVGYAAMRPGSGLFSERFLPHRYCYLAQPDLIWSNVATDAIIFVSYVLIFGSLMWVAHKSRRLLDPMMIAFLVSFGAFILACGLTHMMEVVVIWYPLYWLAVALKAMTAVASATTAVSFAVKRRVLVEGILAYQRRLEVSEAEKRHAIDAAVNAEKLAMIGRLSASISHEINNPLDAVGNIVYCARHHDDLPEELRPLLEQADAELRRVSEITHSTLAFYRSSLAPENVNLKEIVHDSLGLMRRRARERGVTLASESEGSAVIEGYGGELRQVLINLVRNGIEASRSGGVVKVRVVAATDDGVASAGYHLVVEDEGCGIAERQVANLFRPTISTKATGNGLGLWIVRQIIEKHGGRIDVESRTAAPSGTRFIVWLPTVFASGKLRIGDGVMASERG